MSSVVKISPDHRARITRILSYCFRPKPRLKISEWAGKYRYLAAGASAESGKFHLDRVPYQRDMLDDPLDPEVTESFWMIAAQMGKSESMNSIIGYYIDQDPSPILVVYPTLDGGAKYSKKKLTPMINATPRLRDKVRDPRARDSGNTILDKEFPGGDLTIVGANSPAGLRQLSKKIILKDEIDTYQPTPEGDPCELADARAETFHDAVFLNLSTPTFKGASRIETGFEKSDKQYWFCPCHLCGEHQTLTWDMVKWDSGQESEAWMECKHCGGKWEDHHRIRAIQSGEWRSTAPFKGVRGRHLNGLYRLIGKKKAYSTFLHEFVVKFRQAKSKGREGLMVWVNTFLAETFEDEVEKIDDDAMLKRRESYTQQTLPDDAVVLTAAVDCQVDRLELEIVAWGPDHENWGVLYTQLPGSPLKPEVWEDLEHQLDQTFKTKSGFPLKVASTCIDSGGEEGLTETVYRICKPRFRKRWFAIKGSRTREAAIVPKNPSHNNKIKCPVFVLGTASAKDHIFTCLGIEDPGPNYMHFPDNPTAGYDGQYFKGLTAEEKRVKIEKGKRTTYYHQVRKRNEPLDLRVYNLAARLILNPNYTRLRKNRAQNLPDKKEYVIKDPSDPPETKKRKRPTPKPVKKGKGWITNF